MDQQVKVGPMLDLTHWVMTFTSEELDKAIDKLELKRTGDQVQSFQRVLKRLLGDYSASEFVPNPLYTTETELWEHREDALIKFTQELGENQAPELLNETVAKIYQNKDDRANNSRIGTPNANSTSLPQNVRNNNEEIVEVCTKEDITQPLTTTTQSTLAPISVVTTDVHSASSTNKLTEMVQYTSQDGNMQVLPRIIAEELIKLQRTRMECEEEKLKITEERKRLEKEVAKIKNLASSTKITERQNIPSTPCNLSTVYEMTQNRLESQFENIIPISEANKVRIQDTFQVNYYDNNSLNPEAQSFLPNPLPRITENTTQANTNIPWRKNTVNCSNPNELGYNSTTRRTMSSSFLDVGRVIRSWNVKFSGQPGTTSIDEFLQRVEECNRSSNLTEVELINGMSEILLGVAIIWYRQNRSQWRTWRDFCEAARWCYGVDQNFQVQLHGEAERRKQHPDELARDYIFCLLTIINKLEPPWPMESKLDLLLKNLNKDLLPLVRREKILDIKSLVKETREAEQLIRLMKD